MMQTVKPLFVQTSLGLINANNIEQIQKVKIDDDSYSYRLTLKNPVAYPNTLSPSEKNAYATKDDIKVLLSTDSSAQPSALDIQG